LGKNRQESKLRAADVLEKRTLILGESGSGKTKLVAKLAEELMTIESPDTITVIDFAPKKTDNAGGRMADYMTITDEVKYLAPEQVHTPRLMGTSREQVLLLARLNRKMMEPLLSEFVQNSTKTLIMNDITLYLHSGTLRRILQCAKLATTFLGTAYYGSKLANDLGTGISSREKKLTDELATSMDRVVRIS
jgi:hypothetical protein